LLSSTEIVQHGVYVAREFFGVNLPSATYFGEDRIGFHDGGASSSSSGVQITGVS
jgi:hypothetical protein